LPFSTAALTERNNRKEIDRERREEFSIYVNYLTLQSIDKKKKKNNQLATTFHVGA